MSFTKSELDFIAMSVRQQNHKDEKAAKHFIKKDGKLIAASGLEKRLEQGRSLKRKLQRLQKET